MQSDKKSLNLQYEETRNETCIQVLSSKPSNAVPTIGRGFYKQLPSGTNSEQNNRWSGLNKVRAVVSRRRYIKLSSANDVENIGMVIHK